MKILLISNMYPSELDPSFGTFVQNFNNQMKIEGLNCQLAVIKGREGGVKAKLKKYYRFFKDVVTQIKGENYDIIYVHYAGHSLLPLLLVTKNLPKPLIINMHGGDVFTISKLAVVIQKLVAPIVKRADLIVVPSQYFKHAAIEKFALVPEKVFVSPSGGVDTEKFKPKLVEQSPLDSPPVFTVGYVSRIDEGKGWDVFLAAMAHLQNRGLKLRALMVGGGKQQRELLQEVKQRGLQAIVDYKGPLSHVELPNYFNQFDVFVFPTKLAESLGLVGLEAMACGVPVVGSNIAGLKGYIEAGVNGELFTPGDAVSLAGQVEKFITMDKAQRQSYKDNALATAATYSAPLVRQELANKIKEFIAIGNY